ncbi:hypothetical protein [Avibacterium paragallinarum]|uniref:hypothetical protein n=1 Tax=Avibacterium paragallinarum TaxID=728 RepID=UPI0035ABA6A6
MGENRFTVTDDAQTLWEMNARGINLTTNRIDQIKSTLKRYGLNLNDRAESTRQQAVKCLHIICNASFKRQLSQIRLLWIGTTCQ